MNGSAVAIALVVPRQVELKELFRDDLDPVSGHGYPRPELQRDHWFR